MMITIAAGIGLICLAYILECRRRKDERRHWSISAKMCGDLSNLLSLGRQINELRAELESKKLEVEAMDRAHAEVEMELRQKIAETDRLRGLLAKVIDTLNEDEIPF